MVLIDCQAVEKIYRMGEITLSALHGINLQIEEGEFVIFLGASGAGKTTMLNLLGGMDRATRGKILVDGIDICNYKERQLTNYRRTEVGFVFQFYNLVQNLTAIENVELASGMCREALDPAEVLKEVGLGKRMDHFPAQLSGGEQQRVAIARALAKNPKLLLCDEPTGALDDETGRTILSLLQQTCKKRKKTVIVITHNTALAPMADRLIRMKDGEIIEQVQQTNPLPVEKIIW